MSDSGTDDDMPALDDISATSYRSAPVAPPAADLAAAESTLRELGLPEAQIQLALAHCDGTPSDAVEQAFTLPEPHGGWESVSPSDLQTMLQQLPAAAPSMQGTNQAERALRELGLPEAQIQLALAHCDGTPADAVEQAFLLPEPSAGWDSVSASELQSMLLQTQRQPPSPPASGSRSGAAPPVAVSSRAAPPVAELVQIQGLKNRPELNGSSVDVLFFDAASQRYAVKLEGGTEIKLKALNLSGVQSEQEPIREPAGMWWDVCERPGHRQEWKVDQLCEHCGNGHLEALQGLEGLSTQLLVQYGSHGQTPLYTAALEGQQDIAEWLVALGAPINQPSRSGRSLLWAASSAHGHAGMVKWLVHQKADPNAISDGETALLRACIAQNYACAEMLITHGADPLSTVGNQSAFSILMARFRDFESQADQCWRRAGVEHEDGLFVMPSSVEYLCKELAGIGPKIMRNHTQVRLHWVTSKIQEMQSTLQPLVHQLVGRLKANSGPKRLEAVTEQLMSIGQHTVVLLHTLRNAGSVVGASILEDWLLDLRAAATGESRSGDGLAPVGILGLKGLRSARAFLLRASNRGEMPLIQKVATDPQHGEVDAQMVRLERKIQQCAVGVELKEAENCAEKARNEAAWDTRLQTDPARFLVEWTLRSAADVLKFIERGNQGLSFSSQQCGMKLMVEELECDHEEQDVFDAVMYLVTWKECFKDCAWERHPSCWSCNCCRCKAVQEIASRGMTTSEAEKLMTEGNEHVACNRYSAALVSYNSALSIAEQAKVKEADPNWLFLKRNSHILATSAATAALEHAVELDPQDSEYSILVALALKHAQNAIQRDSEFAQAHLVYARCVHQVTQHTVEWGPNTDDIACSKMSTLGLHHHAMISIKQALELKLTSRDSKVARALQERLQRGASQARKREIKAAQRGNLAAIDTGLAPTIFARMQQSLSVLRQDDKTVQECQLKLEGIADSSVQLQQNVRLSMVRYEWDRDAAVLQPALSKAETLLRDGVLLPQEAAQLVAVVHEAQVLMGCAVVAVGGVSATGSVANGIAAGHISSSLDGAQAEEDALSVAPCSVVATLAVRMNATAESKKEATPSAEEVERMVLEAGIPAAYLEKLVTARTQRLQAELEKVNSELENEKGKFEMLDAVFTPLYLKERELTAENNQLKDLALAVQNGNSDLACEHREQRQRLGLEDGVVVDTIKVKTMGELDSKWLTDRNVPIEDISFYQDCLIGDKGTENWYPLQVRNGEYEVNSNDPYVIEIGRKHGPNVMNHVVEKFREKDSANASGGYLVQLPWVCNDIEPGDTGRKATTVDLFKAAVRWGAKVRRNNGQVHGRKKKKR